MARFGDWWGCICGRISFLCASWELADLRVIFALGYWVFDTTVVLNFDSLVGFSISLCFLFDFKTYPLERLYFFFVFCGYFYSCFWTFLWFLIAWGSITPFGSLLTLYTAVHIVDESF
ncbi:hypothetical protein TcG_04747 [Trypanosoma cruzi]|nr:hypothetical protein TcG_04747 [Trypanosoma cruzi]